MQSHREAFTEISGGTTQLIIQALPQTAFHLCRPSQTILFSAGCPGYTCQSDLKTAPIRTRCAEVCCCSCCYGYHRNVCLLQGRYRASAADHPNSNSWPLLKSGCSLPKTQTSTTRPRPLKPLISRSKRPLGPTSGLAEILGQEEGPSREGDGAERGAREASAQIGHRRSEVGRAASRADRGGGEG